MCGRYTLANAQALAERYGVTQLTLRVAPRFNIAPGQFAPVIRWDGGPRADLMRWGLVPSWSKDEKVGYATFNARAEGIAEKPAFRGAIRRQRCLVPADGFYEWRKDGARKQPYFIAPVQSPLVMDAPVNNPLALDAPAGPLTAAEAIFSFAGLYDIYRQGDGSELWTYTIITTTPNAVVAPLHNRMAVVLRREDEDEWLDPTVTDPHQVARLLRPAADDRLTAYPISPRVNDVGHEGADLIAPLEPPAAPPQAMTLF